MPKSTTPRGRRNTAKPQVAFPLFRHATGRWAKKVRGKFHYFGKWADDPEGKAALEKWLEEKDDLLAGRKPRPKGGLTLENLCDHFLTHKLRLQESGELAPRTFARYKATCWFLVGTWGQNLQVENLRPEDFEALRARMAKRWGPVALANEIQIVRSLFRYGVEAELLDGAVRFGPGFRKPSAKTLRMNRTAGGPKMFSPDEIRACLDVAAPNVKAMVLLGINGGLGNTDIGLLPLKALDLKGGWLDYPRSKTGMPRRIPLWPETVDALQAVLLNRREPKDPVDAELVFIGSRGQNFVADHRGGRVTRQTAELLEKAGVEGRSFYDLRRTFQTVAEGARDLVAVQSIMGHAPASGDMSAVYRQGVEDDRLRAVADHVRGWLFGGKKTK